MMHTMTQAEKVKELTGVVLITDPAEIEKYWYLFVVIFN